LTFQADPLASSSLAQTPSELVIFTKKQVLCQANALKKHPYPRRSIEIVIMQEHQKMYVLFHLYKADNSVRIAYY
jgi:hypothetical protein